MLTAAAVMSAAMIYVLDSGAVSPEKHDTAAEDPSYRLNFIKSDTYTTPYGEFEPIDRILEINEYMTQNPNILPYELCTDYIVKDGNAEKAPEIMGQIQQLSDTICRSSKDKVTKARDIAMWVGTNVAYDKDAASDTVDARVISLEAILENEFRTTCGGFANLYSALCYCQGIYCLNMKGGTSADGYQRHELEKAPANHEWNCVFIDSTAIYVDCTWISDLGYENGEYTGGNDIKPFYASFGFGEMSIEHRIDRCEYREYIPKE